MAYFLGHPVYFWPHVEQVLYCAIPKAASTSWKTLFAVATQHPLTSSMSEHQVESERFMRRIGLRFLDTYSSRDVAEKLATYLKLVVVRHPLTRLVSAFGDKVARHNPYGEEIRRKIATAMTSPRDVNRTSLFTWITFANFVGYDRPAFCVVVTVLWDFAASHAVHR